MSWQICKFLHFSIPRHSHDKRLPWQHWRLMRIVVTFNMIPIGVRLNLKNFILLSYAVFELLRKVSQGGGIRSLMFIAILDTSVFLVHIYTRYRCLFFKCLKISLVHIYIYIYYINFLSVFESTSHF